MRKLALITASTLLIAFNAFAGNNNTTIDAKTLAKNILNGSKAAKSEKGSFAIVYGGQDISRGTSVGQPSNLTNPVLVG